jgi:hypothetical protein
VLQLEDAALLAAASERMLVSHDRMLALLRAVRARPGRLRARSAFYSKAFLYGTFAWGCRALDGGFRPGQNAFDVHRAATQYRLQLRSQLGPLELSRNLPEQIQTIPLRFAPAPQHPQRTAEPARPSFEAELVEAAAKIDLDARSPSEADEALNALLYGKVPAKQPARPSFEAELSAKRAAWTRAEPVLAERAWVHPAERCVPRALPPPLDPRVRG